MTAAATRQALRLARSAAAFNLSAVCAYARVDGTAMRDALRELPARGPCAAAAAQATTVQQTAGDDPLTLRMARISSPGDAFPQTETMSSGAGARHRALDPATGAFDDVAAPLVQAGLRHRACPPPIRRALAAANSHFNVVPRPRGAAGWAGSLPGSHANLIDGSSSARELAAAAPARVRRATGAYDSLPGCGMGALAAVAPAAVGVALAAGGGRYPNAYDISAAATLGINVFDDDSSEAAAAAAAIANAGGELLAAAAASPYPAARAAAATNPACPVSVAAALAADPDRAVRVALAANPACPPQLLAALAADDAAQTRAVVAANPACTPDLFAALAADDAARPRAAVAANPACPPELFAILIRDDVADVCAVAAANPACPPETFAELAHSNNPKHCWSVATNPACPPELLTLLAVHASSGVRRAVAQNPNCLREVLETFAADPDRYVRFAARSHIAASAGGPATA